MFQLFQSAFHGVIVAITTTLLAVGTLFSPASPPPPPRVPQAQQQPPPIAAFNRSSTQATSTPKQNVPQKSTGQKKTSSPSAQQVIRLTNAEIIRKVKPSVVYIETGNKIGSGFIIDSSGIILTNAHVVQGKNSATVTLSDGSMHNGTVLGRNEDIDLALIKIDANNLTAVELGDSDQVAQGDPVYAFGYPFGIGGDVSFTAGTLSRRVVNNGATYLETSVEIHPGNSGGPLVGAIGKVVGINTETLGLSINGVAVGETIKLAIPVNTAKAYIPQLKTGQNIVKPQETNPPSQTVLPPAPPPPAQPMSVLSANEDFSQYTLVVSLNKLTNNPSFYVGKRFRFGNFISQFMPRGGSGGNTNYVMLQDPITFVRGVIEISNDDDYAKVASSLTVGSPIRIFGIGGQTAKFTLQSGTSVSVPIIEARRVDICSDGSEYTNTGDDPNDPWIVGCYGTWKQVLP